MKIKMSLTAAALLSCSLLWADPAGNGHMRSTLPESTFNQEKVELAKAPVNKKPYRLTARSRIYDHEVRLRTPFARAAAYVQANEDRLDQLTYAEVAKAFDGPEITVELRTQSRNRDKSEAVMVVLKTEAGTLQPVMNKLVSSTLQKIGYRGEQFYVVERVFTFDMAAVAKAKTLTVSIVEYKGHSIELPVELDQIQ